MKYRIEIRSPKDSQWTRSEFDEDTNSFDSYEFAEGVIRDMKSVGGEWAETEYRIVEATS